MASSPTVKIEHSVGIRQKAEQGLVDDARLLRKIDARLMPWLVLLFFLSSLDKTNIANARIFGLDQDLRLENNEFNTSLLIYFVSYIVFDIPATIAMQKVKPHIWLAGMTFAFGIISLCQGFAQSYGGLLAARFFLGIAEAGSFSGSFYLIAMWYRPQESQRRFTGFYCSIMLASAFGGLLASAIGLLDGHRGYSGWRWIFIIEGAVTAAVAPLLFYALPDFPKQSNWLSDAEKNRVIDRLNADDVQDGTAVGSDIEEPASLVETIKFILQPKTILGALMYFSILIPSYGFGYFSPTIIHTYTSSAIETQLLSVGPWASGAVLMLLVAHLSDHLRHRYLFATLPLLLTVTGLALLLSIHDRRPLQYAALYLVVMGTWTTLPILICWFAMNVRGHRLRAWALGLQIAVGQVGAIPAVYAFLGRDAPEYRLGYGLALGFVGVTVVLNTGYFLVCWRENVGVRARGKGKLNML